VSVHLVVCASRVVSIPPSHKLLLLCLAEDSRNDERHASPGLDVAMRWTMLSRSRVFEALRSLEELRLVEQIGRAHGTNKGKDAGRRATFVVFPDGCCETHGLVVEDVGDGEPVGVRRRELTPAQTRARHRNLERIAARRAESASDTQDADCAVDSPAVRTLTTSQGPTVGESGSDGSCGLSDRSDPSRELPTSQQQPPGTHLLTAPHQTREVETDDDGIDLDAVARIHASIRRFAAERGLPLPSDTAGDR
jgi:hypothetical protein